ncbi:MAG: hypothetical protein LBK99_21085 [Opitutaceae bacterium]|jgi:post-segregation antitoxin (ccd killing protein)|nr:hypothetical protein [Opitutaceae bacterium]
MKKLMILIPALALGVSLFAASAPTSLELASSLRASAAQVSKLPVTTAAERAARTAASIQWHADNDAAVEALLPSIEAILAESPATASFVIKNVLTARNTVNGKAVRPFKRDAGDLALAARLNAPGLDRAYYFTHYATAEEIAALPGSNSAAMANAVRVRTLDLAAPDLLTAYYTRCLGTGLFQTYYNNWFDIHVSELIKAGKDADAARLSKVEGFVLNQKGDATKEAVKQRLIKLRGGKQLAE